MQVKVAVNGGVAIIDVPDSIASSMSEAELTQWIAQNVDRSKTRAGTIIPMADPSPYPVQQYQTPSPSPAPAPTAGKEDVYGYMNPSALTGYETPLPPEQGYTGFMRQVPGLIMDGGALLTSNPLYAGLAGGLGTTIAGSKLLREGSVTPLTPSEAGQKYRDMSKYNPRKMFMADPDALRGGKAVIDQFNKTAPTGLLPGSPMPPEVAQQFGVTGANPTYNQAGADMQNKLNLIAHSADFAKNYGIKLPDVEAKIKAGDMDGALDDIYKAIEEHQKTNFSKIGEKISSNYKQGGVKQVAKKAGQKTLDATKNLPKNAITATGNLLNKNALTRGAGGALAAGIITDAVTSLKNIGLEDALEEQANQAKEYRKFAEDKGYMLDANSEELEAIKRLHANPETRHLLYQR